MSMRADKPAIYWDSHTTAGADISLAITKKGQTYYPQYVVFHTAGDYVMRTGFEEDATITVSADMLGIPYYMAPEVMDATTSSSQTFTVFY